jgi:type I restriction enzyme R subunit
MSKANEFTFQTDMINRLLSNGWLLGKPEDYNRELVHCALPIQRK